MYPNRGEASMNSTQVQLFSEHKWWLYGSDQNLVIDP